MAVWNDTSKYACLCPNGTAHSLDCCTSYIEQEGSLPYGMSCPCLDGKTESPACCDNNFWPASLNVSFDLIPAEDVVRQIVQLIDPYLKQVFTEPENLAFQKYNNPDKVKAWDWRATGMGQSATQVSGLYDSTQPVMYYNASEVGQPFKNGKTLWQTCEGLVRQVSLLFCFCISPLCTQKM